MANVININGNLKNSPIATGDSVTQITSYGEGYTYYGTTVDMGTHPAHRILDLPHDLNGVDLRGVTHLEFKGVEVELRRLWGTKVQHLHFEGCILYNFDSLEELPLKTVSYYRLEEPLSCNDKEVLKRLKVKGVVVYEEEPCCFFERMSGNAPLDNLGDDRACILSLELRRRSSLELNLEDFPTLKRLIIKDWRGSHTTLLDVIEPLEIDEIILVNLPTGIENAINHIGMTKVRTMRSR